MSQLAAGMLLVIGMTVILAEAVGSKEPLMSSNSGSEITIATAFDNYDGDARLATRWGFAQGNRVKESCGEEACEEVVVPGGGFTTEAQ